MFSAMSRKPRGQNTFKVHIRRQVCNGPPGCQANHGLVVGRRSGHAGLAHLPGHSANANFAMAGGWQPHQLASRPMWRTSGTKYCPSYQRCPLRCPGIGPRWTAGRVWWLNHCCIHTAWCLRGARASDNTIGARSTSTQPPRTRIPRTAECWVSWARCRTLQALRLRAHHGLRQWHLVPVLPPMRGWREEAPQEREGAVHPCRAEVAERGEEGAGLIMGTPRTRAFPCDLCGARGRP